MRATAAAALTIVILVAGCSSPTASPTPTQPSTASRAPSQSALATVSFPRAPLAQAPGAAAMDVARRLTESPRLVDAVSATQDALAYAGVATRDAEEVYVEAVVPVAGTIVSLTETFNLALEAQDRESAFAMTAAELGQMLADFGWPFLSGADPGQEMVAFFAAWVNAAREAPDDPLSFGPLFIAEMTDRQAPPVDLAAGSASPDELRFSMLELIIFAAAFDRELTAAIQVGATPSIVLAGDLKTACAILKNETSILTLISDAWRGIGAEVPGREVLGQLEDWAITEGFSTGLESALERIGVGEGSIDDLGKALDATGIVMRVWKLVVLYRNVKVLLSTAPVSVHKPIAEDGAEQVVSFLATVGIPPEDVQEFRDQYGERGAKFVVQAHKCLDLLGLPAPATVGTITSEIKDWLLEWTPLWGKEHIDIRVGPDRNKFDFSPYRKVLTKLDDYTAETELFVDIQPEPRRNHDTASTVESVQVAIRAEAETADPPSLSTFIDGAKGGLGLADAIVELVAGWIQSLKGPSAVAVIEVTYHVPAGSFGFAGTWPRETGNHGPQTIAAVSCTGDLSGTWAVLAVVLDLGVEFESVTDAINDPANRMYVSLWRAGEPGNIAAEIPYEGVLTPSTGPPPRTVTLHVTSSDALTTRDVHTQTYELSPVESVPDICSRA